MSQSEPPTARPPWPDLLSIATTSSGDCTECDERFVNVEGDTMTGVLLLAKEPDVDQEAATKLYVDTQSNKWFDGPGPPVEPVFGASPGDYYLDTSNGDVYQLTIQGV